jgi:ribulose kinase
VILEAGGRPVSISPTGQEAQNVIVWMDHRALAEAERINETGQAVLHYVGDHISPEMETPKVLWLKEPMLDTWAKAAHLFDLPDFLTWRATGALCSTVCKWTYLGHKGRWDTDYFRAIGLGDLAEESFARIGTDVLGLDAPVGTSAIDAHASSIGVIGAAIDGEAPDKAALEPRLALIGGTWSCHMAVSARPRFVPGVWGPYFSAMVPALWLNEGGQSATGALVNHVVADHGAGAAAAAADVRGITVYEYLNAHLADLAAGQAVPGALTADLHVLPYFHGNRSPRADASLRGMVSGLRLASGLDDLALLYLATIQGIAHGTKKA